MGLIDILVRLLVGLFMAFFFGVRADVPLPPEPTPVTLPPTRSMTTIRDVQVIVLESSPMQVQLHVTGEQPDGCELPVQVDQQREGNTVTLSIYRDLPGDVFCPMVLQPYEDSIMLDGTFEPGDYVFIVNDFVVEQTL